SDSYEAIAVCDVEPSESKALADSVIARLISDGIIEPTIDPESTLGSGGGDRPGPNIRSLYNLSEYQVAFWALLTNGVQAGSDRWVNQFGFLCINGFTCPACSTHFELGENAVSDAILKAVGSFLEGSDSLDVACPNCATLTAAPKWKTDAHLGFTNL